MSLLRCTATTGERTLSVATQTVLQIQAPSNQRIAINEWQLSLQGTDSSHAPVKVQVVRQTDAGSGSSSVTPVKINSADDETPQATVIRNPTGEPTTTDIIDEVFVPPNGGIYTWGPGNTGSLIVKGAERIGFRIVAGNANDYVFTVKYEE